MEEKTIHNVIDESVQFATDEQVLSLGKQLIEENREAFEELAL